MDNPWSSTEERKKMNMKGNLKLKFRRLMRCLGFAKLKVHAKACAFSNTHMDSPKYHESFSL